MRLASLNEHQLLLMWVQLLIVLAVARLLGEAARRIGQPAVVGELLAGVLLGPSLLAKAWPTAAHWLVPQKVAEAAPLNTIGWIGVAFLLVLTGFETDLAIVRRLGRPATYVAIGGLVLPFAVGLGVGFAMPQAFRGPHGTLVAFVLFIAVSLAISSLPVIAKILDELGLMRRDFAQVTIAVGMVNDLIGWLALGIIAALGRSSSLSASSIAIPLVAITAFMIAAFTIGQRVADSALRRLRLQESSGVKAMTVTILLMLAFAAATQAARSDAVLGAYVAGIVIGRSKYFQQRIRTQLESLTMAVFAPLFFATAGLRIDVAKLATPTAAWWAGVILLVAIFSKVIGAYGGARFARLANREGLALAIGLNCRGAVEVVIATVGLSIGVLSPTAYSAIVLMAIATSVMAPPLLRLVTRGWEGTPAERERLQQEETLARNLLIRPGRLLVPTRGGASSAIAARVLDATWPRDVAVTLLSVDSADGPPDLSSVLAVLGEREVEVRHISDNDVLQAVVDESKLGYAAIGLGARDSFQEGSILSPVVDDVLAESPVPMVIVRRAQRAGGDARAYRRVLVPVAGTPASRTAQELGYALSRSMNAETLLVHVVDRPAPDEPYPTDVDRKRTLAVAHATTAASAVIEQATEHAEEHDVQPRTRVVTGPSAGEEILVEAHEREADLIVLGTTIRRLEDRAFLGHTVEHVLQHAEATVVVVATPDAMVAGGLTEDR